MRDESIRVSALRVPVSFVVDPATYHNGGFQIIETIDSDNVLSIHKIHNRACVTSIGSYMSDSYDVSVGKMYQYFKTLIDLMRASTITIAQLDALIPSTYFST